MESLGDGLKKILLAGIGTVATTAEKSKDILDEMVKKGELTVEQGKVLNQELKHNFKKTMEESFNAKAQPTTGEDMDEMLGKMTPEQIEQLKEKLANLQMAEAEDAVMEAEEAVFENEETDVEKTSAPEE